MSDLYQTVPEALQRSSKGSKWNVLAYLRGNLGFVKSGELAVKTGFQREVTEVYVRRAVTELIELGYPIISGHNGYKLARSLNEILIYIGQLEQRKLGLDRRIKSLRRVYEKVTRSGAGGGNDGLQ